MKVGEHMRIPEPVLNEDFYMVKRIGGNVTLPSPKTRFEEFLYIYAGGTIERPIPKTVEERFLDYITGGESELPAPKTRLQSYMYNVANPSNKIPVVPPKTRFECYWFVMATANAIISTDNPVEFTSLDGFLFDYTIWGNTEQDLSKIDISNAFVDGYSIDDQTGLPVSYQGRASILNPLSLSAGTYYVDFDVNTENITCIYSVIDGDTLLETVEPAKTTPFTFTLSDNYLVYFTLLSATADTINSFTVATSTGQIYLTPLSATADTINSFTAATSTGQIYPTPLSATADTIKSFTAATSTGQIYPTPDYHFDVKGVGDYSTNKYIIPLLSTGQENSQSATNSIVLDEPLHAIDNYADSVNYLSQKETRRVKKLVIDGTNVKFSLSSAGTYRDGVGLTLSESERPTTHVWSNIAIYSDFIHSNMTMRNVFSIKQTGNTRIYLYYPKNYIDIESPTTPQIINFFNNKAQELYNNGTPIIIYYVPSASEETTAELPKIPTYAPTTELTVDTEVDPSKIEVVTRTE